MLTIKLDTGFNIELDFPIAAFHKRLFAWIIDIIICFAYLKLISLVFDIQSYFDLRLWLSTIAYLPVLLYHLIMEISFNGQSIGKKAMHIRVITEEGGQPSVSQYLIRWMFRLVDLDFVLPGLLCIIISEKSQRIGDLVAGTLVIDTKTTTSWQDTVFTEIESDYHARFPQVMRLSDKDINTLKSIIERVKKKHDYSLSINIMERIKSKLNIQSDMDSLNFLETLLKDYNYYSTK